MAISPTIRVVAAFSGFVSALGLIPPHGSSGVPKHLLIALCLIGLALSAWLFVYPFKRPWHMLGGRQ